MNLEIIKEVESELERFQKRLKALKHRTKKEGDYLFRGCKETAALKRAALDLKNELTKLTQPIND